jgi:hypothetical protein
LVELKEWRGWMDIVNGWTTYVAEKAIRGAFEVWRERSEKEWEIVYGGSDPILRGFFKWKEKRPKGTLRPWQQFEQVEPVEVILNRQVREFGRIAEEKRERIASEAYNRIFNSYSFTDYPIQQRPKKVEPSKKHEEKKVKRKLRLD